jgi:choline-sulfatase
MVAQLSPAPCRVGLLALLLSTAAIAGAAAPTASPLVRAKRPARSLVLITLDTTRADALGCYGAAVATPALDGLAARGLRYASALTASPLTLPAHTSLLTGLEPPEHGVRDNGTSVLGPNAPTLAAVLAADGYATAAFVSSRVLDRRFGLDRGFLTYDDRMAAEQTGEYGYPERDGAAVTAAALGWLASAPRTRPFFLWVHYYDPHAPYEAAGETDAIRYAGEVAAVDRQVGRLLAALPQGARAPVVAVVGDHGESLGEHGERGHGLFLYGSVLHVPLILAGPGVPAARVIDEPVASRRLASTLLHLLGTRAKLPGPQLPGFGADAGPQPVYSETWLPATAYGWSPLRAWTDGPWRYVDAPRPELYDIGSDPLEVHDRVRQQPQEAERLRRGLLARTSSMGGRQAARAPEPGVSEAIRSLGYLSGASGSRAGTIDPKDGLGLLAEAKAAQQANSAPEAVARLRALCAKSPGNVPFLNQLASAQTAAGDLVGAARTLREARDLNPLSEFAQLHLAQALLDLGQTDEARRSYQEELVLNPRAAGAWLALAEMAKGAGRAHEELELLRRGAAAGTQSAVLLTRLAQLELAQGQLADAGARLREATSLWPAWPPPWLLWGAVAEREGKTIDALARYQRALALAPDDPDALLHAGRLRLRHGDVAQARRELEAAVRLAPGSASGREARRLLALPAP